MSFPYKINKKLLCYNKYSDGENKSEPNLKYITNMNYYNDKNLHKEQSPGIIKYSDINNVFCEKSISDITYSDIDKITNLKKNILEYEKCFNETGKKSNFNIIDNIVTICGIFPKSWHKINKTSEVYV